MANDSEISVKIGADVSEFEDGANQASETADQLTQKLEAIAGVAGADGLNAAGEAATRLGANLQSASESANTFGTSLATVGEIAGGVLTGLSLEGLADKFKDFFEDSVFGAAELGEKLQNLSISTGISTDDLQELRFAAQEVGVSFDKVQMVVNRVSLAMLQFSEGSKTAVDAANILGIDPTTFTDAYDALTKIGERVREIGNLTLEQRGALEQWIGGRGGSSFLPVLEQLGEAKEKFDALNLAIDPGQVQANAAAAEKVNTLDAAFGHLKDTIGGDLTSALASVSDYLTTQVEQLSLTTDQYNAYVTAVRAGASTADALKDATTVSARGLGGMTGGAQESFEDQLAPAQETAAQLKTIFDQTVTDYETSQRLILAAAGDTAEARMAYEKNVLTFLESQEGAAAAAGVDLSAKIGEAAVAGAAAQTAAYKESNEALKAGAAEVQAYVRQQATDQLNALDSMYEDFKTLGTDTLEHIKEKWGEVNAAEQEATLALKDTTTEIADVLEPLGASFDQLFNSMLESGKKTTLTLSQEFMKMSQEIGEDLIRSGIKDLLVGGKEGSIGGALSTALTGQSGGIAGEIAKAFAGSAISTSLRTALSSAWTGLEGTISNVFGQAFTGIEGIIKSLFGSALSGAGGGAADAGASAAGGAAAKALGNMDSSLVTLVAQSAMGLAQDAAYYAESLGDFIMMIITEATSVHPFGFAGGGIVPSAAGGMVVGGPSGGSLAIVHPQEMILPANLSKGVQDAIDGGGFGSGGGGDTNVIVNFTANGVLNSDLRQHADTIADIVADRVRQQRFTGQGVKRGAFRR